ncbi:hypothetical protein DAMA08_002100 [Martiniozyma asiatica (nom. inval.)]|nr:hypothetical protein DAMA08_002100 [Martiniozyma asiatica]
MNFNVPVPAASYISLEDEFPIEQIPYNFKLAGSDILLSPYQKIWSWSYTKGNDSKDKINGKHKENGKDKEKDKEKEKDQMLSYFEGSLVNTPADSQLPSQEAPLATNKSVGKKISFWKNCKLLIFRKKVLEIRDPSANIGKEFTLPICHINRHQVEFFLDKLEKMQTLNDKDYVLNALGLNESQFWLFWIAAHYYNYFKL